MWTRARSFVAGFKQSSVMCHKYIYIYIYTDEASRSWIGGLGEGGSTWSHLTSLGFARLCFCSLDLTWFIWCHFDFTLVSLRVHFGCTSIAHLFHFDFTFITCDILSVSLRLHCMFTSLHFDLSSITSLSLKIHKCVT